MSWGDVLNRFGGVRVGIFGDFCLDAYWLADMRKSVLSRETPHFPLPIVEERMSPGAAGNVACNAAALHPASVHAVGLLGSDWRGDVLRALLKKEGIDTAGLLRQDGIVTNAYIKPLRSGISQVVYEDPRLDFENRAALPTDAEDRLIEALAQKAYELDVLCVCDQLEFGVVTERVRAFLAKLGCQGLKILVDSRSRIGLFRNIYCKPNDLEAMTACQTDDPREAAQKLCERNRLPVVVTLGENGCLTARDGVITEVPGFPVEPPVDIVGAGDTFLASLAVSLASGAAIETAATVANAAASVTVKKLGTTGTASRAEILDKLRGRQEDEHGSRKPS